MLSFLVFFFILFFFITPLFSFFEWVGKNKIIINIIIIIIIIITIIIININKNSIIYFTKRYNRSEVILYCIKYDSGFVHQDQYTVNSDYLPPLVVLDSCLYIEKEILKREKTFYVCIFLFINKLTNIFITFYLWGTEINIIQVWKCIYH